MGEGAELILMALGLPAGAAILIGLLRHAPNLRETATLAAAAGLFWMVWRLAGLVGAGERPSLTLVEMAPGLSIAFAVEPLGALFALIASGLWVVNALFAIGYMRGNRERDQTRFYMLFPIAIGSALGIAFAADLVTMFVFYEVLTLSTYPLVAHKGDEKARRGARVYLAILLGASLALLLPAIVATYAVTGELAFRAGGVFPATTSAATAGLILVLFAFGLAKAALMPLHGWLPAAMVAPTPVSALLHAVAVVKAGVFVMLKASIYLFGPELMQSLPAAKGLAVVAGASIVIASLIAWKQDDLKARLAYSTVSQLAYVTLGAMLATPAALLGAALQILMHAFGKITLFMSAGAIYTASGRTRISAMTGLGRVMPWTFAAFFLGALSVIGLPPLAGAWVKLELMTGSAEAGRPWLIAVLALSSVLNVAYLLPLVGRGVFLPPPRGAEPPRPAPWLTVLPPCLTAAGCLALFFFADRVGAFLAPVFASGGSL
jgi:multicomponent Na+:H+ antiporter subunit D